MPLPKPKKDETHDEFIDRCMSDDVMKKEYDDNDQRLAVCQSQWDNSRSAENLERRILTADDMELRVDDDNGTPKLKGYAAKYGKWSVDLGGFTERIKAGAFDEVLADDSDVRALKNHNPDLLLGRTASGTLRLNSNSVGLQFEADLPNTTTGNDIKEEVQRKDITGCSFSFTVAEDVWKYLEDDKIERTIVKVGNLFDVGPVTYPAYPDTTVAVRSLEMHKKSVGKSVKDNKETEELKRKRQRDIDKGYKKAGRIINRNKPADD